MKTSIPVLCYHNISDTDGHSARIFEEHLAAIRNAGFCTISARELLAGLVGEAPILAKTCVLTFDDGHLSNWTIAAPLLAKYGMTGVFFCVTDFIGQGEKRSQLAPGAGGPELLSTPESFRRALDKDDRTQFMNEAELRAMVQDFGFEVYGHSARHQGCFRSLIRTVSLSDAIAHWSAWGIYPSATRHGPEAAQLPLFETGSAYAYNGYWPTHGGPEAGGGGIYYRRRTDAERRALCLEDFRRCFARMRDINGLGDEQYFCWPWGEFDTLSESCLREAGFKAAFTLDRNANTSGTDPFRINRIGLCKTRGGAFVLARLHMYSGSLRANIFSKSMRKWPEIKSVLYMTDVAKLSGDSRQLVNNVKGMRESGLKVTVVIPPGSEIASALAPLARGENSVELVEFGGFRQYVRAASFVAELAERVQADVVHTFQAQAYKIAAMAKLNGARFSLFINQEGIVRSSTIFALCALAAKGVICDSHVCAQALRLYQVKQSRLRLVYQSFLPENGMLPPERQACRKGKCGVRVLYVGTKNPVEGFDVFLRVAAELCSRRGCDLEFVGVVGVRDVRTFEALLTPQLKPRLSLLGNLPNEAVLREFQAADILFAPSCQESLPNVLLEAFACCLPVVCASVGGMPELVRNGLNGFLRPSEDIFGLAEAVARLAEDPALRLQMGRINRWLLTHHLSPAAKTLTLLRVYFGEPLYEPLPIETMARQGG